MLNVDTNTLKFIYSTFLSIIKININRFYYINSTPDLRNDEKLPKNGSLNRDLLNFFNRYGIFWVPPGEWSARPSYGRLKFTLISREKK